MRRVRRLAVAILATVSLGFGTGTYPAQADYAETARVAWQVLDGRVRTISVHGNRVYIGGTFTRLRDSVTGQRVTRLRAAAFDRTTGELVDDFDPAVDQAVWAIDVSGDGSRVFLGGDFQTVNGAGREHLAAVDRDGALVPDWSPSPNGQVRDLVTTGNSVYVGGGFGRVDGLRRQGVARVGVNSGVPGAWTADTTGGRVSTLALAADGSLLYVGGAFQSISGQGRAFLAAVRTSDGAAAPWDPSPLCATCRARDVVVDGSRVYAAITGPGGRVAAWDARRVDDRLWARSGDGDVQVVAHHEGTVYVGGHFGPRFAGEIRHQLAAVDADDGDVLGYNPIFTGSNQPGMWAMVADSDFLRVGGGFRGMRAGPQQRYGEFRYR